MEHALYPLLFFLITLCGCSPNYPPSPGDRIANQITAEFANEMEKEHEGYLVGLGGGGEDGKICRLTMSFDFYRPLSKDEVRRIIVGGAEKFLKQVNSSEELQPYLKNYPLTIENLKIFYFIYASKERKSVFDPDIGGGYLSRGSITYLTDDPDHEYQYKSEEVETYENALEILRHEPQFPPEK